LAAMAALAMAVCLPMLSGLAFTVRAKSESRWWQTVMDQATPLGWTWQEQADSATVTFSNVLTRVVSSVEIGRGVGALRGECPHPVTAETAAYFSATLVQSYRGVEIMRETANLAYVPGCVATAPSPSQPITVRTKSDRNWFWVKESKFAAFDASWWKVPGPSGYEIFNASPVGTRRVAREFEGVGEVDAMDLKFGVWAFTLIFR